MLLNVLLGTMESLTLSGCQYYFLAHNKRTIYRNKFFYLILFILECAAIIWTSLMGNWIGNVFFLISTPLIGWMGFHRKWNVLVYDSLYGGFMMLIVQAGLWIAAFLQVQFQIRDVYLIGNLAMFFKILFLLTGTWCLTFFMGRTVTGKLSRAQAFGILVLPCFSSFYLYSLSAMCGVYLQLYGMTLLSINILALLVMNFYFFYLLRYLFRSNRLEKELSMFQAQNELRYRYYEDLEQKYRESRKILHDMKNHLQAVEELYGKQENELGEQYVKDLYHMLNVLGEQQYTSNKMLNMILNEKLSAARSRGIHVSVRVGDVDLSDLKEIDITTIFANLLDNAIEAAEDSKEKRLSVKMDEIRDFRVVQIVNSRTKSPEKKKREGHMGFGLENVKNTLKKYHGSMNIEEDDQEYRVHLMLPGKEEV